MDHMHVLLPYEAGQSKRIGQYGQGVFGPHIEDFDQPAELDQGLGHAPAMGRDNRIAPCGHDRCGHVQGGLFGPAGFQFGDDLQQGKVGRKGQGIGP